MKTENQNNNLVDFTPDSSRNDSSQEEIVPRYPIPDIEKNNVEKSNLISLPPIAESFGNLWPDRYILGVPRRGLWTWQCR